MNDKIYYLAYGSNLNLKHMDKLCNNYNIIGTIKLKDYQLVYKGYEDNYSYLTIEKKSNSYVPMVIFELNKYDIKKLDDYENYPALYYKKYIDIKINDKVNKALIYIINDNYDYHIPSIDYIYLCSTGYDDFNFDKKLLDNAFKVTINKYSVFNSILKKVKESD